MISPNAFAVICSVENGDINKPNDYLLAITKTLKDFRNARTEIRAVAKTSGKELKKDPNAFLVQANVRLKTAIEYYHCTNTYMDHYLLSENNSIKENASAFKQVAAQLSELTEYDINNFQKIFDGKSQDIGPGTRAVQQADRQMSEKKTWELFNLSIVSALHILLDLKNSSAAGMKLLITGKERSTLVSILEKEFGKSPYKKENHSLEFSAQNTINFLNDKWKSSDTK